MSLKILDGHERGSKTRADGLGRTLIAVPRTYPTRWAIAWTILLLVLCLAPQRVMPDENSMWFWEYIPYSDLAVHFTLFAGFVMSWIPTGRSPLRWALVPAVGLLLAVGTEYAQGLSFIHRDPNLLDGLADSFGVVVGTVGAAILGRMSLSAGENGTDRTS